MPLSNHDKIPPPMAGCDKFHFRKGTMTEKIRQLEVGEYVIFPIEKRTYVHRLAEYIDFKIVTRQMGSPDTFRCYRVV